MFKKCLLSLPVVVVALHGTGEAQTWTATNTPRFGDANNEIHDVVDHGGSLYALVDNSATGVEVWRFDGTPWVQSNQDGFGDTGNSEVFSHQIHEGRLYVATANFSTGTEVWSLDGTSWTQANSDGFGSSAYPLADLYALNGDLYAMTPNLGSGCEVWKHVSGSNWTRIGINGFGDANNYYAELEFLAGSLYAGAANFATGCEVLRHVSGTSWVRVDPGAPGPGSGGFDASGASNEWAGTYVYQSKLYVGTENVSTGTEAWRYDGGTTWAQVNTNGFGNPNNKDIELAFPFNNLLYVGTISSPFAGAEVWQFNGGSSWTQVGSAGFGSPPNEMIVDFQEQGGSLYASTLNQSTGSEVWRFDGGASWTRVDPGAPGPGQGGFGVPGNASCELAVFGDLLIAAVADVVWRLDPAVSYCTGKTTSVGCIPFITTVGLPSVSATGAFNLTANDVVPAEAGFVIYAVKKSNLNFHGGKLCVKAPFTRTPAKSPKNPGGGCSGWILRRNFNATIQSGNDPTLTPGRSVTAQWRQRDPADPAGFGDALTDAVRFTIYP